MNKTTQNENEPLMPDIKKDKNNILIELVRKGGRTYFDFAIPEKIEKIFAKNYKITKTSEKWNGLKFYFNPEVQDDNTYLDLLSNYSLRDNYGNNICEHTDGKFIFNIAWLRTVGGLGRISVDQNIPFSEFNNRIKDALYCIKSYFENYLREFKIRGTIEVEG